MAAEIIELNEQERQLLNQYQHELPLCPNPYAEMAASCGMTEKEVIEKLRYWDEKGVLSRVGAVINHQRLGASTLAALAVPEDQLEAVADLVSGYPEVNHNYKREHRFNLWFVLAAPDQQQLDEVLEDIEARTQLPLLNLPMLKAHHLDLGFAL
ncbi:Lrp/AsnC family transcriptional regulator [Motiliproteus coralliicola]|uniref:siroheme decarboxylase n=1 Tax=Motiliproteus coralliicola TaxID=2283196 RepID=A0A369WDP1_9GAMM|nr:Lrp/AsnC family transcriptional regulator [Motiliproteus coralliicola]RDE19767.1 Lrp/AsnC family transcriptional regulator [Motiliproteus coralliicola]